MNVGQMLDNVRTRLGDCRAQKPSDRQILLHLTTNLQAFFNRLSISNKPWAVDELTLVVTPGNEDYALPIDSSFGKPIRVRTSYAANPSQIIRDIEFFELTDSNFDWNLPANFGNLYYNLDGSPNTAMRIAFYRRAGLDQIYARIVPTPQLSATYVVLYQIGVYGETAALADVPVLPEHHSLIELWTTLSVLPIAEWYDAPADNSKRREEFALAINNDCRRLESDFNQYIRTVSVQKPLSYRALPFSID